MLISDTAHWENKFVQGKNEQIKNIQQTIFPEELLHFLTHVGQQNLFSHFHTDGNTTERILLLHVSELHIFFIW